MRTMAAIENAVSKAVRMDIYLRDRRIVTTKDTKRIEDREEVKPVVFFVPFDPLRGLRGFSWAGSWKLGVLEGVTCSVNRR